MLKYTHVLKNVTPSTYFTAYICCNIQSCTQVPYFRGITKYKFQPIFFIFIIVTQYSHIIWYVKIYSCVKKCHTLYLFHSIYVARNQYSSSILKWYNKIQISTNILYIHDSYSIVTHNMVC